MCKNCFKPVSVPVSRLSLVKVHKPALSTVPASLIAGYPYFGQFQIPTFEGFPAPAPIPAPTVGELIGRMRARIGACNWEIIPEETEEEEEEEEEETVKCYECDDTIGEYQHEINGRVYCDECCTFCDSCNQTVLKSDNDFWDEQKEELVCEDCFDRHYATCQRCNNAAHDDSMESGYCEKCREHMSTCHSCDEWYDLDYMYYSERDCEYYCEDCKPTQCDGTCEQSNTSITLKEIEEETRFPLVLSDASVVSEEGFNAIMRLVSRAGFPEWHSEIRNMGRETVTKEGKFSTRLGALLQKSQGPNTPNVSKATVKVTRKKALKDETGTVKRDESNQIIYHWEEVETNLLSEIGNLVAQHTLKNDTLFCSFTRDLNKSAGYYVNSGSCWFGSEDYSRSRCLLKHSGGFAFLQHDGDTRTTEGRVWIQPCVASLSSYSGKMKLSVTTDETEANVWLAFNGYHETTGNAQNFMASLFAKFMELETEKFNFEVSGMYINGGTCHMIADQETLSSFAGKEWVRANNWEDCDLWD